MFKNVIIPCFLPQTAAVNANLAFLSLFFSQRESLLQGRINLSGSGFAFVHRRGQLAHEAGRGLNIWESPFFFSECWRGYVLLRSPADLLPNFTSLHHDTSLSSFGGLRVPGWVLLFGGEVSGGVENAASHRGYRYHSEKRCSLPAVLPRSSGETQLPQRSHLCVVGFLRGPAACLYGGLFFCPTIAAVQKVNGI